MSEDIRDALRAYAATTPDLDPRAGLGTRLARRDRRRKVAIVTVACLAALVAGTGVAALGGDGDTSRIGLTDDPTPLAPTPAGEPPSPTLSPTGSPSPSPADEEPPETADPTHAPTTAPAPDPQPEWFSDNGLTLRADLDPAGAPTATTVALRVTAEDDDGFIQVSRVSWGDGSGEPIAMAMYSCPQPPSPAPTTRPLAPGSLDRTYTHAWRHDGTFTVTVSVESTTACSVPQGRPEQRTVRRTVVVSQGEVVSNGPAEPVGSNVVIGPAGPDDPRWVLDGTVSDQDGYVTSVTIDWGDGSEPAVLGPQEECADGDGAHYPRSQRYLREHHEYDPGSYQVTVTWVSAGCDGADEQTGSATVTAEV